MLRQVLRAAPHLLPASVLLVVLLGAREWAYATSYRLYVSDAADASSRSTATQRFDLEDGHVVPQIAMRDDRLTFQVDVNRRATLRGELRPAGPVHYDIRLLDGRGDRLLCQGTTTKTTDINCAVPPMSGRTLAVNVSGEATWADLRLERHLALTVSMALTFATMCVLLALRQVRPEVRLRRAHAQTWAAVATMVVATCVGLVLIEGALRLVGTRISQGLRAARHDLGEQTEDPRWQPSSRYGQRLTPRYSATNAWRDGDIIRMGFVSPALADGTLHRYTFQTDAEGFRNDATRDPIDVAALGDSFTDAQTIAVEAGWPWQLEQRTGLVVQNYGTAGFGPQQELNVLRDFALRHRPRVVVLAFFAGNDVRDAEVFDLTGKTHIAIGHPQLGWPIKRVVTRADGWFVVNAIQAASAVLAKADADRPVSPAAAASPFAGNVQASFDRGIFTVPVNGRVLRWAFMPPYLLNLMASETRFGGRDGWKLAQQAIRDMQRDAEGAGAQLVVMFLPFKSQVYLPLLSRALPDDELRRALAFSLRPFGTTDVDVSLLLQNRLALNTLMQRFCEQSGLPFLDTTEILRARAEAGEAVYFPDDSHLNEAGEGVVAAALADFLRERGLAGRGDVR